MTLSENQYAPKFIRAAKANATTRPCWPPSAPPTNSSTPLSRPRSAAVFRVLLRNESPLFVRQSRENNKLHGATVPVDDGGHEGVRASVRVTKVSASRWTRRRWSVPRKLSAYSL